MLTPKGLEEKGRLTVRFLKTKLAEYKEIKNNMRAVGMSRDDYFRLLG